MEKKEFAVTPPLPGLMNFIGVFTSMANSLSINGLISFLAKKDFNLSHGFVLSLMLLAFLYPIKQQFHLPIHNMEFFSLQSLIMFPEYLFLWILQTKKEIIGNIKQNGKAFFLIW